MSVECEKQIMDYSLEANNLRGGELLEVRKNICGKP
jgi:hypothetical protein